MLGSNLHSHSLSFSQQREQEFGFLFLFLFFLGYESKSMEETGPEGGGKGGDMAQSGEHLYCM